MKKIINNIIKYRYNSQNNNEIFDEKERGIIK